MTSPKAVLTKGGTSCRPSPREARTILEGWLLLSSGRGSFVLGYMHIDRFRIYHFSECKQVYMVWCHTCATTRSAGRWIIQVWCVPIGWAPGQSKQGRPRLDALFPNRLWNGPRAVIHEGQPQWTGHLRRVCCQNNHWYSKQLARG